VNFEADQSDPANFLNFSNANDENFQPLLDGKTLNVSSSQADGEVNLFGFEDKPTFNDNRDKLQRGQVIY
jgi:hypothetical protein